MATTSTNDTIAREGYNSTGVQVIGGWERHKDRVTDIVYAAATPVTCRTTFSLYQLLLKY
ncbi:hypothetical protein J6590_085473 [Homalodisca vitripennis]|nr:hypothetical protein J6590_085473 [Homalodisca vitripennis]